MRSRNLLIVGTAYQQPARFPQCDITWTTLSAVNADRNIVNLPNLVVWDCHDRPGEIENVYDVPVLDLRGHMPKVDEMIERHGPKFANQFCYMMADVAREDSPVNHVTLYGVGGYDAEHINQFQYMTYWLGYLDALGVSHTICQPSALLRPATYIRRRQSS